MKTPRLPVCGTFGVFFILADNHRIHNIALKTNRTYNIGILFLDAANNGLTNEHFARVLQGVKEEAESRGYDITFINHHIGARTMTYTELPCPAKTAPQGLPCNKFLPLPPGLKNHFPPHIPPEPLCIPHPSV